jgi:hypothetical protein
MPLPIAKSIREAAAIFDRAGRTDAPIRVYSSRSSIDKARRYDARFSKGEGGALFYDLHPLVLQGRDA